MPSVGEISVELAAKVQSFIADFKLAEKSLDGFGKTLDKAAGEFKKLDDRVASATASEKFQNSMKLMAVAAGLSVAASVKAFAEFERGITRVAAVTDTIGTAAVEDFSRAALELAATTEFTARQVADAMGFMGQAGFTANQILAATPGVLQLASAAMIDVGRAADITTNVLSGFGLATAEISRANDVLIATTTSSNTNLEQLGQAFKFVGPVAKGAGLQFEEVSAALGLMGNAGIQASMAGTSLRGAITRLQNPTKAQGELIKKLGLDTVVTDGKLSSFTDVIKGLEKSGASSADIMALFGQRAGPGMQVLVEQGSAALIDFQKNLEGAGGTAERLAEAQLNTLSGQFKILQSEVESAAISFGSGLAPAASAMISVLSGLTFAFQAINEELIKGNILLRTEEDLMSGAEQALDRRSAAISKLRNRESELVRALEEGQQFGVDTSEIEAALVRLRRGIKRFTGESQAAVTGIQDVVKTTDEAADAAAKLADEFEKAAKAAGKIAEAQRAAAIGREGGLSGAVQLLGEATTAKGGELKGGLRGDELANALGDLGANAAAAAETLLLNAKTLREFDDAASEAVDQGLLFAEDIEDIADVFSDKLLGAAEATSDFEAGMAAVGEMGFIALLDDLNKLRDGASDVDEGMGALSEQGFPAFLQSLKDGAAAVDKAAEAELKAAGAGAGQALLNPTQFANSLGSDMGQAMGDKVGSVLAGAVGAGAGAVIGGAIGGEMVGAAIQVAQLIGDTFVKGITDMIGAVRSGLFDPVIGTSGGAGQVVGAAQGALKTGGQFALGAAAVAVTTPLIAMGVAMFVFGTIMNTATNAVIALGLAVVAVVAVTSPLVQGLAIAAAGLFTLAAAATAGLSMTSLVLALGSQSEQAKKFGDVLSKAADIVTNTAGNIFTSLLPIAGMFVLMAEAIAPVVNRFTGLDQIVPILFDAIKATAIGVLTAGTQIAIGFEALATAAAFAVIGVEQMTVGFAIAQQSTLRGFREFARSLGIADTELTGLTQGINDAAQSQGEAEARIAVAQQALSDIASTVGRLEDATDAIAAITLEDSIGAAAAALDELKPPVDDSAVAFKEMNQEVFNTVRGMRVATQRLRASDPAGGFNAPISVDAAGSFAGGALTIIIEQLVSAADNVDELFSEIQQRGQRAAQQVNGNPFNQALEGIGFG